jgi:hypothetical protein
MWACMIALPVFALIGSGWSRYLDWGAQPEENQRRGNLARSGRAATAPQTGLTEMMRGQPRHSRADGAPEPAASGAMSQPGAFSPSAARQLPPQTAERSEMPFGGPTAHLAASFDAPANGAATSRQPPSVVQASNSDELPMELPRPPSPVGSRRRSTPETAEQPARLGNERSIQRLSPPAVAARSADWFSAVAQRLRDLGATYYLLETWGRNGELYRFHCKMAVAGSRSYTRHFEATSADAALAMRSVLEQVEAWRAGRSR